MAYESIFELPIEVKKSLSDFDCKCWMDAYNACKPVTKEDTAKARRKAWRACMELPSSFSFKIIGSSDTVDQDKEKISIESIMAHLDEYIDNYGGTSQAEHGNYGTNVVWDWEPTKTDDGHDAVLIYGNVFGGGPTYDAARKAFIEGRNNLSVAGEATMGQRICTPQEGCYIKRDVTDLLEISLVKNPSNKFARLQWYNKGASFTKSESLAFPISHIEVHKDYTVCPMQALAYSLQNIGYTDVHAKREGAFIKMSYEQYCKDAPRMNEHGLRAQFTGDGVYVRDEDAMIEKAFKKGYSEGWIDKAGNLVNPTREQFDELFNASLLYDGHLKRPSTYKCMM